MTVDRTATNPSAVLACPTFTYASDFVRRVVFRSGLRGVFKGPEYGTARGGVKTGRVLFRAGTERPDGTAGPQNGTVLRAARCRTNDLFKPKSSTF